MKRFRVLTVLATLTVLTVAFSGLSCSSVGGQPEAPAPEVQAPPGSYEGVLGQWTDNQKSFKKGAAPFAVSATLLAPEVLEQQAYREFVAYRWTPEQYKEARDKALYQSETETTFFVALYTPNDEQNDLNQSSSIWNVFLETGGRRLTPSSIKKDFDNKAVIKDMYPYISVWDHPYFVTFAVPARDVIGADSYLNITGVVGSARLKFPQH